MKRILAGILAVACMAALSACGTPKAPEGPAEASAPEGSGTVESGEISQVLEEADEESIPEAGKGDPEKKAILVVSFGTSYQDTRDATIGAIEADIQAAFPDYEVRRAFTSQMIIKKLKERDNLEIDNVTGAMDRLVDEGFGTVVVQPTHVMNGSEYDEMVAEVSPYQDRFETLRLGTPLLTSTEDYQLVADALRREFPREEGTAVVLMGHGSEHFANNTYAALAYHFLMNGDGDILIGTVEGFPGLQEVLDQAKAMGAKKVVLAPLMVVAGDHAANDMAGDEDDSWKTVFKSNGYEVEVVMKGMGEYPGIRALYVQHAAQAINAESGT